MSQSPGFFWRVLTLCILLSCSAVSTLEGSLLYLLGNGLLMTALAYLLISVALKYGRIKLYTEW